MLKSTGKNYTNAGHFVQEHDTYALALCNKTLIEPSYSTITFQDLTKSETFFLPIDKHFLSNTP